MTIRWSLARTLKRARIANAFQLAERAGIGYPAAVRIFAHVENGDALGRFDMRTLDTLAKTFRCSPWSLLRYTPD